VYLLGSSWAILGGSCSGLSFSLGFPFFRSSYFSPRIARVGKIKFLTFVFHGFGPNPGPGRRPLDSVRRDADFAGVFASVAFLTVSFVPDSDFAIRQKKSKKVRASKTGFNICIDLNPG